MPRLVYPSIPSHTKYANRRLAAYFQCDGKDHTHRHPRLTKMDTYPFTTYYLIATSLRYHINEAHKNGNKPITSKIKSSYLNLLISADYHSSVKHSHDPTLYSHPPMKHVHSFTTRNYPYATISSSIYAPLPISSLVYILAVRGWSASIIDIIRIHRWPCCIGGTNPTAKWFPPKTMSSMIQQIPH